MFAKFSPDNSKVGYVSRNNVYVQDLASGQITQLTHDGAENIINGTSDWVNEEEFDIRDGVSVESGQQEDCFLAIQHNRHEELHFDLRSERAARRNCDRNSLPRTRAISANDAVSISPGGIHRIPRYAWELVNASAAET